MKILVVDDEKLLVKGVKFNLENEGYEVTAAYDGAAAVELAKKENFDLIVMDVMMPGLSGSEACMQIREFSDVPIIMLTARSEDSDKLMGFACGADDYVTKPFRVQELLSRIRVLLRKDSPNLTRGELEIDQARMQVLRQGAALPLTLTEYKILLCLIRQRGVATRDILLGALWDSDGKFVDDNTLSVHISRLREKIGGQHIQTVRGVGYQWVD